jgi:ribosomal protein S18 acetylase RimI-like enzyme
MGRPHRYESDAVTLIAIRPYEDTEVTAILELWSAAGLILPVQQPDRDIRNARTRGRGEVFVAEYQSRLIATIMVGREEDRGWLYYLAVEPSVQRKGIGRAMVRHAEKWLRARGIPRVMLMVRENNRRVRGFYERLGYQPEPRHIMSRSLVAAGETPPQQQVAAGAKS